MPISKNKIKYIKSLELKKNRNSENVFVAEGNKTVDDLLKTHLHCTLLVATAQWLAQHQPQADEIVEVTKEDMPKVSSLKCPTDVVAVFQQPKYTTNFSLPNISLCLALDGVQDPGNLGTIIRLADWFGIEHIYCSEHTVDVYNTKVVQATMGAIGRVQVHYTPLVPFIQSLEQDTPIYGTFLDGDNIYSKQIEHQKGLIVMGNEGKGISKDIETLVTDKLFIPNYPSERATSESLNVAIATAIVCAEFRRPSSLK